jgi:hypothetical protein
LRLAVDLIAVFWGSASAQFVGVRPIIAVDTHMGRIP